MRRLIHLLLSAGIVATVFGLGIYHAVERGGGYRFGQQNALGWYGLLALFHVVAAYALGLPDEVDDVQPAIANSVIAGLIATGSFALLQAVVPGLLPRFAIVASGVAVPFWTTGCTLVALRFSARQRRKDRVFAIVTAEEGGMLKADAEHDFPYPERAFSLVGVLDPIEIRGSAMEIVEASTAAKPSLIVLSEQAQTNEKIVEQVAILHAAGMRVRTLTMFYDEWLGKLPLAELRRMALLFDIGDVHRNHYAQLKRVLDIAGAVLALLVAATLTPLIIVGNIVANAGPLLFSQQRVGRDGRVFTIHKFRTMRVDDPESVSSWTALDDPRITRFGGMLRRAHIDELPQAWNVLRGDLSLVGPRPEQPHYVAELETKLAFYGLRHAVQPGITGWAQVKYRYAATEADSFEKLQYDLFYLRHQSLTLDLRIISRTLRSVLSGRGR